MKSQNAERLDDSGAQLGLPGVIRNYLLHTDDGVPIRQIARHRGCHASTVQRQIRRVEAMRDDALFDAALTDLSETAKPENTSNPDQEKSKAMNAACKIAIDPQTDDFLEREARRILRRLSEPAACLAYAADMEKAVVVRETPDGRTVRTAVTDREVAQAMAIRDWLVCAAPGRVSRYRITTAGRAALKRLLAKDEARASGFAEAAAPFGDQHRDWQDGEFPAEGGNGSARMRFNAAESPVASIARRRDRDGTPFLSTDLIAAAERLREDFELAQMGPRIAQNWERFLSAGSRGNFSNAGGSGGSEAARNRVMAALTELGPGLGDVVLRVCCFLEGLESAEKRLGWSARSGKIVLRIALQRLKQHYDATGGGNMIG